MALIHAECALVLLYVCYQIKVPCVRNVFDISSESIHYNLQKTESTWISCFFLEDSSSYLSERTY